MYKSVQSSNCWCCCCESVCVRTSVIPECLAEIIKTLRPEQNRWYFADSFFNEIIFIFNGNYCILIQISLSFVPECPIYNKSSLVQVMAWCCMGDRLSPESMVVHIYCIICQWALMRTKVQIFRPKYLISVHVLGSKIQWNVWDLSSYFVLQGWSYSYIKLKHTCSSITYIEIYASVM